MISHDVISITDTVGNLIAFSDGTFSGDAADQLLSQTDFSPDQSVGVRCCYATGS